MSTAAWHLNPLLCIDTETTGINPYTDRIVEIAAVEIDIDGNAHGAWSTIVDCGVDIPVEASAVHGISTSRSHAEGVAPAVALTQLAERIYAHHDTWQGQAPIVIYQATFDWPLILTEAERHEVDMPAFAAILDPLLIDRMVDRYRAGGRKLITTAAHYGVPLDEQDAHGGLADATAAGRVMRKLIERFPKITDHSLATLWLRQVRGHEDWRCGFEDYLRKKVNPDAVIAPGWPIPVGTGS